MNILPKKRWHVRTKDNMARVRRDEAKAAAEEAAREDRVRIAENEDRMRQLRAQNEGATSSTALTAYRDEELTEGSHVNLFGATGKAKGVNEKNKEAEAEAKRKLDDYEHKLGIKIKFGDFSETPWYDKPVERPYAMGPEPPDPKQPPPTAEEERKAEKRKHKEEKKQKCSKKHKESSSDKMARLRAERLTREATERQRTFDYLHPEVRHARNAARERTFEEGYSNQFNPHLIRRRR